MVPFPATNFPSPVQRRKWQGANCSRDEGSVLTAPREGRTQLTNPSLKALWWAAELRSSQAAVHTVPSGSEA